MLAAVRGYCEQLLMQVIGAVLIWAGGRVARIAVRPLGQDLFFFLGGRRAVAIV